MGIKHKSTATNTPSKFTTNGLVFSSRSGYYLLKNLDYNAKELVDAIKAGSIDIKEFFGRFDKIKVKETYADAAENLELLFENITRIKCINDPDYFKTELDFGGNFYSLLDIEYFDD